MIKVTLLGDSIRMIGYGLLVPELLGDEYDDFLKSYDEKPVRAFRVNTDKISLEAFQKLNIFSNEKIPYVENGFYFDYG